MARNDPHRLLSRITDLLERERQTLLRGEIANLSHFARRKEELLSDPALALLDQGALERIRAGSIRNQQLLSAALDAVRLVRSKLDDLRAGRQSFKTYGPGGHSQTLHRGAPGQLERRA